MSQYLQSSSGSEQVETFCLFGCELCTLLSIHHDTLTVNSQLRVVALQSVRKFLGKFGSTRGAVGLILLANIIGTLNRP